MPGTINSPNMLLPVPQVGVESGPDYATDINNCLSIIDQHDHTTGYGVPITPAGLNINASLPMANNLLSNALGVTFFVQTVDPGINTIYEKGVDLYFKDGSGNVIRLTQSGSVAGAAGTITGLPSGTASASFAASVFTFQAATLTAANIDGGSFVLRNNTASSFGLTLAPPNAMGANYGLVLPSIPAQTNVMTLDNSGNMGSITYNAVGQAMTATGANAILASVTTTNYNLLGKAATEAGKNLVVSNTNATNSLAIIRGSITSGAAITSGEGFTVSSAGTGSYQVVFTTAFGDAPAVTASATTYATVGNITTTGCTVNTSTANANFVNAAFCFIAIGQRA